MTSDASPVFRSSSFEVAVARVLFHPRLHAKPEGWKLLTEALARRGKHSLCVDLKPGEETCGAADFAARINASLDQHQNVIAVARSASGLLLPLLANYRKVTRLVYLAAVLPQPGFSFVEQHKAAPEMYRPEFVGKDPTADASLARTLLFHDCDEAATDWAITTLRLTNARRMLVETTPLVQWPPTPSVYISCRQDRALNAEWWEQQARDRLGIEPLVIDAGHAPHVSQPELLAGLLDTIG